MLLQNSRVPALNFIGSRTHEPYNRGFALSKGATEQKEETELCDAMRSDLNRRIHCAATQMREVDQSSRTYRTWCCPLV